MKLICICENLPKKENAFCPIHGFINRKVRLVSILIEDLLRNLQNKTKGPIIKI